MESSEHNWANISRDNLPRIANFWRVGVLDVVLSEYLNKSHNFTKIIFMTSSLRYSIQFCDQNHGPAPFTLKSTFPSLLRDDGTCDNILQNIYSYVKHYSFIVYTVYVILLQLVNTGGFLRKNSPYVEVILRCKKLYC